MRWSRAACWALVIPKERRQELEKCKCKDCSIKIIDFMDSLRKNYNDWNYIKSLTHEKMIEWPYCCNKLLSFRLFHMFWPR